jgi:hypothetical protein
MISYKLWELKFQKQFFLCRLISKADLAVEGKIHQVKTVLKNKRAQGKEYVNALPHKILYKVHETKQKVDRKYDHIFSAVKGKYVLKNKGGSASVFLRNIAEEKKNFARSHK